MFGIKIKLRMTNSSHIAENVSVNIKLRWHDAHRKMPIAKFRCKHTNKNKNRLGTHGFFTA